MTEISERKVRSRTTGRDQKKTVPSADLFLPNGFFVGFDGSLNTQHVPRSVSTNWKQIAIPRFFADYGAKSNVFCSNGSLRFIPDIYRQQCSSTHFDEALRAVAFISLANQLDKVDLSLEARKLYGSAIVRVATKLQCVEEAADDTIMASSFLFSMFEVMFHLVLAIDSQNHF